MTKEEKDRLNELVDEKLFSRSATKDYVRSTSDIEEALARILSTKGFTIRAWNGRDERVAWTDAAVTTIKLHRRYEVSRTRSANHQEAAEQKGQVAVGDNTYLSRVGRGFIGYMGLEQFHDPAKKVRGVKQIGPFIDEPFELICQLLLDAQREDDRPVDRIRDL